MEDNQVNFTIHFHFVQQCLERSFHSYIFQLSKQFCFVMHKLFICHIIASKQQYVA